MGQFAEYFVQLWALPKMRDLDIPGLGEQRTTEVVWGLMHDG